MSQQGERDDRSAVEATGAMPPVEEKTETPAGGAENDGPTDTSQEPGVAAADTTADTAADTTVQTAHGTATGAATGTATEAATGAAAGTAVGPAGAAARDRKPDGPRRVRNGIKLRSRDGEIPRTALSSRILDLVDQIVDPGESVEGMRYARIGQLVSFDFESGGVVAKVQDTRVKPYEVRLGIDVYSGEEWGRVIEAMAGGAVHLVKLMAGEMPESSDELLDALGLSLLPRETEDFRATCSCGEGASCRHVAAAGLVLAERLVSEPLLVYTLRGMPANRLLDRVRQARVLQARGVASAHVDPAIPEAQSPPPLESCVEEFWRPGPKLGESLNAPPPKHVAHALLRRLGPSPLDGKFPLVGLLASIYDRVTEHAVELRDREERIAGEVDDAPRGEDEAD